MSHRNYALICLFIGAGVGAALGWSLSMSGFPVWFAASMGVVISGVVALGLLL